MNYLKNLANIVEHINTIWGDILTSIQEKNPYDIPIVITFTSVPVKFDDNMLTEFKVALVCLDSLSLM